MPVLLKSLPHLTIARGCAAAQCGKARPTGECLILLEATPAFHGAQPIERKKCRVTERRSCSALCGGGAALSAEGADYVAQCRTFQDEEELVGFVIQGRRFALPLATMCHSVGVRTQSLGLPVMFG
jgi:hypothetical protein